MHNHNAVMLAGKPGFLKVSSKSGQVCWFGHTGDEIHGWAHKVLPCCGVQMPEKLNPRVFDQIQEVGRGNRSKLVFCQHQEDPVNLGFIVDGFFLKTPDESINGFYVVESDGRLRFFRVIETSEHRFKVENWGGLSLEASCYTGTGISDIGGGYITLYIEEREVRAFGPFFQSTFFNYAGRVELTVGRQITLSEVACKT